MRVHLTVEYNLSYQAIVEIEVTYNPVVNIPTVNMMHAHDSSCRKSID